MSAVQKPDSGDGTVEYPQGGGPRSGLTHILWEIDPDTLPEEDFWEEVARRIQAYHDGRDGWRTGEIDTSLDDYRGESS